MQSFTPDPTDLHLSRIDRRSAGRERRARAPRRSHDEHVTRPDRADPLALLAEQNTTRLADLVPVRWGRMAQSPFAFLRGSALVMTDDLSHTPTTGLTVQACGDAHLSNFGGFASPERREVFDLNDFDETLVGPWEWDVKRLAASAAVSAREVGADDDTARAAAATAVRSYCDTMVRTAEMSVLDLWYFQVEIERTILPGLTGRQRKATNATLVKMRTRTSRQVLAKVTALSSDGGRQIIDQPPLITHVGLHSGDHEAMTAFMGHYLESLPPERAVLLQRFRPVDVARKVVGVGSVGTRCYIVLLVAPDEEPLFLQVKEASSSVLERACGPYSGPSGRRVVHGQREIQTAGDVFLGWANGRDHEFYVRQLRDMKVSLDVTALSPAGFEIYLSICGMVLARAHARTGDGDAIAGYLGRGDVFVEAVSRWALAYADQTEQDHARLVQAIADGEIEALSGV